MREGQEIGKIQELVYELRAADAMTKDIISITPEMEMGDLRHLLRENKISGVPVTTDDKLVGIISIEDFINWMADDCKQCLVKDKMTDRVETVFSDELLVEVFRRFEKYGYGRMPVVDRETGILTGIITKGDIIKKLLFKLNVDHKEEEIHRYRASHFFEDIIADSATVQFRYHITEKKVQYGGIVASNMKKTLRRLGIDADVVRRASILIYEAEMNIIIYAFSGEVRVAVTPESLNIEVSDTGPGIPNLKKAMEPGYSTAPEWVRELGFGAGMGLQNIKSCAEKLDIQSVVGRGTVLKAFIPVEKACA